MIPFDTLVSGFGSKKRLTQELTEGIKRYQKVSNVTFPAIMALKE